MKIKLLSIIALLIYSVAPVFAHDFEVVNSDGVTIYYNITNDVKKTVEVTYKEAKIISCSYEKDVVIPDNVTYNETSYSITSIGDKAFYDCPFMSSVTIPDGIKSIGASAFSNCRGLTSIILPNSTTSIAEYAFEDCEGLGSITIPNTIQTIGKYAFYGCKKLTSFTFPASLKKIEPYTFSGCINLQIPEIPSSITHIEEGAFEECKALSSITVNVETLTAKVFKNCTKLTTITISDAVKYIGDYCFEGCVKLTTVNLGKSVETIGIFAFRHCDALKTISLPQSVSSFNASAFSGCSSLEKIDISESNNNFCNDNDGFVYTKDMQTLVACSSKYEGEYNIIDGTKKIGKYAFWHCPYLSSMVIPSTVTEIEEKAILDCSSLTTIVFNGSPSIDKQNALPYVNSIYCYTTTPPTFTADFAFTKATNVYVSSSAFEVFSNADGWTNCNIINCGPFTVTAKATNCIVEGTGTFDKDSEVTLTVVPLTGYEFTQWGDGNTENPRKFTLTKDSEFTIECTRIETPTSIHNVQTDVISCEYYDLNGKLLAEPQKGINVVVKHHADGSSSKEKLLIK